MQITLTLLALISFSQLGFASINESAKIEPFLDIFRGKVLRDGHVKVPVTTYNSLGELRTNGDEKILDEHKYQTLLSWAQPVFRMQPGSARSDEARKGTAFHIGNNLVLTNQHVLDPERKNLTKCEDFRVLDHNNQSFPCKRVIFCNNAHDICLIEMAPKKSSCLFRGFGCKNPEDVTLTESPALKIRATYTPTAEETSTAVVTAIGNSMGLGIHVSQGRGVKILADTLRFYAFATKGNSGGAIVDEEGVLIGLVKQQSGFDPKNKKVINPVGDHTYNIALRVEKVISLCREALKDDSKTLEKFNEAVLE